MDIIAIDDPTDAQILEWHAVVVAAQAGDHADLPTLSQTSARMLALGPRKWAALDGVMAGVVWLRPPVEPGRAGEIDIHVRPEYRRCGVGTALLAVAADELRFGELVLQIAHERVRIIVQQDGAEREDDRGHGAEDKLKDLRGHRHRPAPS